MWKQVDYMCYVTFHTIVIEMRPIAPIFKCKSILSNDNFNKFRDKSISKMEI